MNGMLCDYCGNQALRVCVHAVPNKTLALCPEHRYAVHLAALLCGDTSVRREDLETDKADLARQAKA